MFLLAGGCPGPYLVPQATTRSRNEEGAKGDVTCSCSVARAALGRETEARSTSVLEPVSHQSTHGHSGGFQHLDLRRTTANRRMMLWSCTLTPALVLMHSGRSLSPPASVSPQPKRNSHRTLISEQLPSCASWSPSNLLATGGVALGAT